eukprot:gb/GECG01014543.1/.p1 GENE.gb/GECG01014543.1/~~gb/GECG01014543.1/.p1  ORF type:complete len:307 (+),score=31.18 gb/GECG01014543.1/:1-921(+)
MKLSDRPSAFIEATAGALGSVVAVVFSNPLDVAKTRLQLAGELGHKTIGNYANVFDALKRILWYEGIAEAQKGIAPAIIFNLLLNGVRFGLYHGIEENVRNLFQARREATQDPASRFETTSVKACSATIAGGIAGAIASPFSLIKTRMQSSGSAFKARRTYVYSGSMDAVKKIWSNQGLQGFFRGADAAVLRLTSSSICQLVVYDSSKEVIKNRFNVVDNYMLHVICSILSAVSVVAVMNPLDVAATRIYQDSERIYRSPMDCLVKTTRHEGILALYKGSVAQFIRVGPHTILTFVFYEQIKKLFH